jgi:hypothetical protein
LHRFDDASEPRGAKRTATSLAGMTDDFRPKPNGNSLDIRRH